ncbi:BRCT domain-containing protein [Undibacterium danionis]|uniref:BRCT domain-containing protein n=1 Tax=Undibacterium danionis TaxID=1812100 RepID=A0ABV6IJ67_9BURK
MASNQLVLNRFVSTSQLDKSINSLLGLVEGIAIDGVINETEIDFFMRWLSEHVELANRHPFNELMPVVQTAVQDGILDDEERQDIIWLCEKLKSTQYYDQVTADIQRLHAVVGGIIADGLISEEELRGLSDWMEDHSHLKTCWPFDEIESLITGVLADKVISPDEHRQLKDFFSEFIALLDDRTITSPLIQEGSAFVGLCAVCPEIEFDGKMFCFTGASNRYSRQELFHVVEQFGGLTSNSVSKKISYLVVGADGNPCWTYACYGRKVERAIELRKAGERLLIIHENDFHDAVADLK